MTGWIKLHRQIMEHWIWEDSKRFKWWMEILLLTNHTDKKVFVGGKIQMIKRGSFHTSEVKLSERWNVSRNTVRKFLKLLQNDNMITTKKTGNGTTIEVHNYDVYQGNNEVKKHENEQQNKQETEHQHEHVRDNEQNTTKNVKKEKNYKNVKNEKKEKNHSAFDFFQNNGFGLITQYTAEDINYYLDSFENDSDEIVIAALKLAKDRNKVSWGYTKGILNTWLQTNLNSIDQVKFFELQLKEMRKNRNTSNQFQKKELTPEWLENRQYKKPNILKSNIIENDENFNKEVAAFKDKLNKKWD